MIGILVKLLILSTDAFLPGRCNILRDLQESTKFWTNSKQEEFRDTGCNISAGWNLTGREWGCCGNYEGCCKMASKFCYLHDSICQCCQLGWIICGPECKPDIGCLSPTEKADSEDELTSPSFQLSASLNSSTNENKTLQNHSTNSSYFTKNNKELNKISAKKNGNYDISDSMLLQNITKEAKSADSQDPSLLKHHHEQLNRNRGTQHTTSKATATFKFQDGEQTNDDTLYTSKTTGIVNDELEYSGLSINIPNSNIIEGSGEVN